MLKKQILIALREHVHTVSIPVNPALYREKWGLQGYTLAVLFMILTLIFVANQNRLIEAVLTTPEKKNIYIYCAKIRKISHFYLKKIQIFKWTMFSQLLSLHEMQQNELRDAPAGRMLKVRKTHEAEGYGARGSWRIKRMKDMVFHVA